MIAFEIIAALWFFTLGSVFGSFMNVVVYRTPRGKSIVGPSRCPKCGSAIRWHDNIPVLGWFFLKGQCRDCGLPISPRYPTVEFVTACLFLVLALAELASGGTNLPAFEADPSAGFAGVIADANWPLIGIYALHSLLVTALFCWGLIRVDEMTIPKVQVWALWIVLLAAAVAWPATLPLDYSGQPILPGGEFVRPAAFRTAAFGFSAGVVVYLIWTALQRIIPLARESKAQNFALAAGFTSIGLALGWQSVVSILFLTALSRGIFALSSFRSPKLRTTPLLIDVMLATVIHICFWNRLWLLPSWPGVQGVWPAVIGSAIALVVLRFACAPQPRG